VASAGRRWGGGVLLMLGASIVAPHVGSVLAGYKLEALKQERQTLLNEKRDLEVKEAGLLSPGRLNDLARARNLTTPAPVRSSISTQPQPTRVSRAIRPLRPPRRRRSVNKKESERWKTGAGRCPTPQ